MPAKTSEIDQSADAADRRIAPRLAVALRGRLREQGHTGMEMAIHDLSTHGFQVDTIYRLRPGRRVWLQVAGLAPLAARVCWFSDFRIGCAFERPLHPSILASIAGIG